jgi:hypothetical protein
LVKGGLGYAPSTEIKAGIRTMSTPTVTAAFSTGWFAASLDGSYGFLYGRDSEHLADGTSRTSLL